MALSPGATIVIALACCALVVSGMAAVGTFWQRRYGDPESGFRPSSEQADYMRHVRRMNVASLFNTSRPRPNYYNQHQPSVSDYNGYNGKSPQVSSYDVMTPREVCE